jgi:hypothetical protein
VRAALTDDGLPPLVASGRIWRERLEAIAASLDRVAAKAGALPGGLKRLRQLLRRGLAAAAALGPPVRLAYRWVKQVAKALKNSAKRPARAVRQRLSQLLSRMRQAAPRTKEEAVRAQLLHCVKVTKSYRPGLFHC